MAAATLNHEEEVGGTSSQARVWLQLRSIMKKRWEAPAGLRLAAHVVSRHMKLKTTLIKILLHVMGKKDKHSMGVLRTTKN
jgi:hypothetical protein